MSAFIGALIAAALRQTRDTICLHAGGAVLPSGAILLLGASFAGKSSVAMHLAAGGALFFGDDRIAVADDRALALGLAPKLRLPIPDDAGPVFTRFARARVRSTRWGVAHLRLQRGEAAAFGRRARVRAIVVLKRRDDGPARLVTADRSTAMRSLVAHAFAPQMAAAALVARLAALTSRVPAYTLEFSRSREAARVLWHLGNHG